MRHAPWIWRTSIAIAACGGSSNGGFDAGGTDSDSAEPRCDDLGPWQWEHPLPDGQARHALWGFAEDDIWTGGWCGLWHWNGANWTHHSTGVRGRINAVWGASPDAVWAVGQTGGGTKPFILHWDGTSLSQVNSDLPADTLHAVDGSGPSDVWAVGEGGAVWHFNGVAWSRTVIGDETLRTVSVTDQVIIGGEGVAYVSDGDTFSTLFEDSGYDFLASLPLGANDIWFGSHTGAHHWDGAKLTNYATGAAHNAIWGTSVDDLWTVGSLGKVRQFDGDNWVEVRTAKLDLFALWGWAPGEWVAVGEGGIIVRRDAGALSSNAVVETALHHAWPRAAGDIWAVGDDGAIVHWNGSTWSARPLPDANNGDDFTAVWSAAVDDVYAVGGTDRQWNGTTWEYWFPAAKLAAGVWGTAADDLWVGGTTIQHYDGAWSEQLDPNDDVYSVHGTSSSDIWAAGEGGTSWHYNGTNWTEHVIPTPSDVLEIEAVPGADQAWAVNDSGLYQWRAEAWSKTGPPGNGLAVDGDGHVWVVTRLGRVFEWTGAEAIERLKLGHELHDAFIAPDGTVRVLGEHGAILRYAP